MQLDEHDTLCYAMICYAHEDAQGELKYAHESPMLCYAQDMLTSDPYVVLKIAGQEQRSHVIKKTLNPQWNQDLSFRGLRLEDVLREMLPRGNDTIRVLVETLLNVSAACARSQAGASSR